MSNDKTAPVVPAGYALVQTPITEAMHVAAVKVLQRVNGLDRLPQRLLDAMLAEQASAPFSDPAAMVATKSAGVPGVTLYDLGPSRNPDSAISRKLIEMGWTPPAARCDCGKKLASECVPWEPECDLGKSAEHARPGRFDASKTAAQHSAQPCPGCFGSDCNGECSGDGAMGG